MSNGMVMYLWCIISVLLTNLLIEGQNETINAVSTNGQLSKYVNKQKD